MTEKIRSINDITKPRGTRDMMPQETQLRRKVDENIRETLGIYGFEEIQTPIFEYLALFEIRSGEKIRDDMYWFSPPSAEQKAEDTVLEYCLRPELTAPTCRFYVSGGLSELPKPVKVFYSGPTFRYDTPAPGRFREFYQVGVELLGSSSAKADAEVVTLATSILDALEITDYKVQVNDSGILRALFTEYNKEIQNSALGLIDRYGSTISKFRLGVLAEETSEDELFIRYQKEAMDLLNNESLVEIMIKLIDLKGDKSVLATAKELMKSFPEAVQQIENSSLNEVFLYLEFSGVKNAVIDFSIARGLDYYTGIVFEIDVESLKGAKQICGGGRYDKLIEEYGGEPTPATGFAFGFDRLVISYENALISRNEVVEESNIDVYVVMLKDAALNVEKEAQTVMRLRQSGIRTEFNLLDRKSMKANLKFAQKIKASYSIIIGPQELEKDVVVLRDMGFLAKTETGNQSEMSLDKAIETIKANIL